MKAGLEVLANYSASGRKIAVLGDMFELEKMRRNTIMRLGHLQQNCR